jgi:RimJ/RimL family protein N-acetyltransferase
MIDRDVELSDGEIVLRPPTQGDEHAFYKAVRASIPEISPWLAWCSPDYKIEDTRSWLTRQPDAWHAGTNYAFAVIDQQDGQLLGGCGLSQVDVNFRLANLGYWVRSDQRGRGIAPRATRLTARFGIEMLALVRVEIIVSVHNTPSLRVAEKAGAHREGVLRNRLIIRDQVHDVVMHSLTPADFSLPMTGLSKV